MILNAKIVKEIKKAEDEMKWVDIKKGTPCKNKYYVCGKLRINNYIYMKYKNGQVKAGIYRFAPDTGDEFLNEEYKKVNDKITHWSYFK